MICETHAMTPTGTRALGAIHGTETWALTALPHFTYIGIATSALTGASPLTHHIRPGPPFLPQPNGLGR